VDAAIDIGTNTVRMLLGDVCAERIHPARYFRRITRLGGGAGSSGELSEEAMSRTLNALKEAAQLIGTNDVRRIKVVGTEALRRAPNRSVFGREVFEQTGLSLEVIDGEQEARLSAAGVMAALDPFPRRCLIFDIGGGSTEFVLCDDSAIVFHRSYPLGVVALGEARLDAEPMDIFINTSLDRLCSDLVAAALPDVATSPDCVLVGTAGTVTTLAALKLEMVAYDWRRVNNLAISKNELQNLERRLAPLSVSERETLPGMEKGRGDLILPGVRIVLALMERLQKDRLTVSDFGLLEGILLDLAERPPSQPGCN